MTNPDPSPDPTDEALLASFLKGNRDALAALALRHELSVLGLARGILKGREDLAVDAVQESWIRVIRFGADFDGRSSFKTWLYRIVINQCRTLAAAQDVGDTTHDDRAAPGAPPSPATSLPLETDEFRAALRNALDHLDDNRRTLLLLCYHAGMTHERAAEILEVPIGTLKSRLHTTLAKLRALLHPEEAAP